MGSGLTFEDRGLHRLKGVPDPWRLYAVTRSGEPAAGRCREPWRPVGWRTTWWSWAEDRRVAFWPRGSARTRGGPCASSKPGRTTARTRRADGRRICCTPTSSPSPTIGASRAGGLLAREGRRRVLAHNGCFIAWGSPADFDEWAEAGNHGWSYAELEPYRRRGRGDASCPSLTRGRPRAIHARRTRRGCGDRPSSARGLRRSRSPRRRRADPGQCDRRRSLERGVRLSGSGTGEAEPHDRARRAGRPAALRGRTGRRDGRACRRRRARDLCRPRRSGGGRLRLSRDPASKRRRACGGPRRVSVGVRADVPGVGRNLIDHPRVELVYRPSAELLTRTREHLAAGRPVPRP